MNVDDEVRFRIFASEQIEPSAGDNVLNLLREDHGIFSRATLPHVFQSTVHRQPCSARAYKSPGRIGPKFCCPAREPDTIFTTINNLSSFLIFIL